MKSLGIVTLVLCFVFPVIAQNRSIDSLKNKLILPHADTARLNLLLKISFDQAQIFEFDSASKYALQAKKLAIAKNDKVNLASSIRVLATIASGNGNPEEAIKLQFESIKLSNTVDDKKGLASAYGGLGKIYTDIGRLDDAVFYHQRSLSLALQLKDLNKIGISTCNLAVLLAEKGMWRQAIQKYDSALAIFKTIDHKVGQAVVYQNKAHIFIKCGDLERAVSHAYLALKLWQDLNHKAGILKSTTTIGEVNMSLGRMQEAKRIFYSALEISTGSSNDLAVADALSHIGNVLWRQDSSKKALELYNRALVIRESINYPYWIAISCNDIAIVFFELKNYKKSLEYDLRALEIRKQIEDTEGIAVSLTNLSQTYLALHRLVEAEKHVKEAIPIFLDLGSTHLWNAYYIISQIDSAKGDFASAYRDYKKFSELRDSAFNTEKESKIDQLTLKYDFDRKADSLSFAKNLSDNKLVMQAALIESTKNNRNILVAFLALLFILAGIIIYKRSETKKLHFKQQAYLMEIKALKAQMNPHFIFNALNSIYNFVELNKTDMASSYIVRFARLMRLILKNSMEPSISLKDELEVLQLYVELEKERLPNKFNFKVNIQETIVTEDVQVPPLIFQPFIENSIWHGISELSENGTIQLEIQIEGNELKCVVTDNGKGRKRMMTNSSEAHIKKINGDRSYGMQLTRERIEVLYKTKGMNDRASPNSNNIEITDLFDKENSPAGLRVQFNLPYELTS